MSFLKTIWFPRSTPRVTADQLNRIETGIDDLYNKGIGGPPLVTVIPTVNLVDGQVVDFVADATLGIIWRLRYRAADTSAYKWNVISATPLIAESAVGENHTTIGANTPLVNGPTKVLPLPGDYIISLGAMLNHSGTNQGNYVMPAATGLAASGANGAYVGQPVGTNGSVVTAARTLRAPGISGTLAMYYFVGLAGGSSSSRWMTATPTRVAAA